MSRFRGARTAWRQRRSDLGRLVASGRADVGAHSYGSPTVRTFDHDDTRLVVGRYCSAAHGVTITLGGEHPTDRVTTFPLRTTRESLIFLGGRGVPGPVGGGSG
jgi:hypothetical protein